MSLFSGERIVAGTSVVKPSAPVDVALTVQASDSGQTANLFEIKNSAGTTVFSVSNAGTASAVAMSAGATALPDTYVVTSELLAASVDKWCFIAPRACKVVSVKESHSVVGGAGATVRPRKVTDTSAPGAAAGGTVKELTQAAFDLTSGVAVNTTTTGTLSATASDLVMAAGDKIGLDFSGTLTGLVGVIAIEIQNV